MAKLVHPKIKAARSYGLWIAVAFDSFETNKQIIDICITAGVLTDWFLFALPHCLRISPPLIISEQRIEKLVQGLRRFVMSSYQRQDNKAEKQDVSQIGLF